MKPGPVVQTLEARAKQYFIFPKNKDILYIITVQVPK